MAYLSETRSNTTYCSLSGTNIETATRILDGTDSALFSEIEKNSGKFYAEWIVDIGYTYHVFGISTESHLNTTRVGFDINSWGLMSNGRLYHNSTYTVGPTFTTGDILMVAVDINNGYVWFGVNGTWVNSGDPAAGVNPSFTDTGISSAATIALSYTMRYLNDAVTIRILPSEFTYTAPIGFSAWGGSGTTTVSVFSFLNQPYNLIDTVFASLIQPYVLPVYIVGLLQQIYSLRMLAALLQHYGNSPVLLQRLLQYYGDSEQLRKTIVQLYNDALQIHNTIDQQYIYPDALQKILEQKYFISGTELKSISNQLYDIKTVSLITTTIVQPFTVINGEGLFFTHTLKVKCNSKIINVSEINIEASQDQFCLSCTFNVLSQEDYLICEQLADIVITIDDFDFIFFVESKSRNRKHGETVYTIEGLSKSALLDFPYANNITNDLTGLASNITSSLAAGYIVVWNTVDWNIPPDTLLPEDDSPLTLIRKIASAVGAIIQTEPDGAISIEPLYIDAVPSWNTASPTYLFSDAESFFTTNEQFDHRSGYNKYVVSDQQTNTDQLTLTEEAISGTKKYILAYKIPWSDTFSLEHTGGDWISIEPPIIEEKIIENEIVEFIGGAGKTSKPIYAVGSFVITEVVPSKTLGMRWLQKNLGTISFKEDGTIISSIKEESLLRISYLTKYHKCLVTDNRNEPLQLISERLE